MTLQNNNNTIYEICFDIVWDEWGVNHYHQLYDIIFEVEPQREYTYVSRYHKTFMGEVVNTIFRNDPSIDRIKYDVIENMIIKRRKWLYMGLYPAP